MQDLLVELIKRFGVWVVVTGVLIVGVGWFIVHQIAQRGEEVSVGPIKYTKQHIP